MTRHRALCFTRAYTVEDRSGRQFLGDLDRWVNDAGFAAIKVELGYLMSEIRPRQPIDDRSALPVPGAAMRRYWEAGGALWCIKEVVKSVIDRHHRVIAVVDEQGKLGSRIFAGHVAEVLNMLVNDSGHA